MGKEGDWRGLRHAGERGGRREQGGEVAAMDKNCREQDGDAANGEMIWSTAKEKEKERVRATCNVDTIAAMAVAAMEGRRKRRHCQSSTWSEEDDKEEEGE